MIKFKFFYIIFSICCLLNQNLLAEDELYTYIQRSLVDSPYLETAKQGKVQVQAQQQILEADQDPKLELNIGTGIEQSDAGKSQFQIKAQTTQVLTQQWQQSDVKNQLSLKLITSYLLLQEKQQLLELAKDDLVSHQKTEKQIQSRFKQGVGRKIDVQQVTSRKTRATVRLLQSEGDFIEAQIQLESISFQDPKKLQLNSQIAQQLIAYLPDNKAIALTDLQQHPQLQQSQAQINHSQANYQQVRAIKHPQINLELDGRYSRNIDGIKGKNQELSTILRLRYSLYQGSRQKAQKQAYYHILLQQLEEQLKIDWHRLKTAQKQQDYLKKYQDNTKTVWQAYQQQFKFGRSSLITLLDAETEWYHAYVEAIKGKYALQQAIFNIFAAMGNLNQTLQVLSLVNTK